MCRDDCFWSPLKRNNSSGGLKNALSNIIYSSTLKALFLTEITKVTLPSFFILSTLRRWSYIHSRPTILWRELKLADTGSFEGSGTNGFSHSDWPACVCGISVCGTRFPSFNDFSLNQDREGPSAHDLGFACWPQPCTTLILSFLISSLASAPHLLLQSNTWSSTFGFVVAIITTSVYLMRIYVTLMAGVILTPLPPIPSHGYNININHSSSYNYGEEPDEVEVLKAVFDAFATFFTRKPFYSSKPLWENDVVWITEPFQYLDPWSWSRLGLERR